MVFSSLQIAVLLIENTCSLPSTILFVKTTFYCFVLHTIGFSRVFGYPRSLGPRPQRICLVSTHLQRNPEDLTQALWGYVVGWFQWFFPMFSKECLLSCFLGGFFLRFAVVYRFSKIFYSVSKAFLGRCKFFSSKVF